MSNLTREETDLLVEVARDAFEKYQDALNNRIANRSKLIQQYVFHMDRLREKTGWPPYKATQIVCEGKNYDA